MSPILLRPIREQLEHDRIIRQLQGRWRRRYDVSVNLGGDEEVSVRSGARSAYPDLILTNTAGGRRVHGVVEVETASSVNHLEAMAEWTHFAKARGAFYLYVPAGFTDVAQRLCEDSRINVTEIWAYYAIGTQAKFSLSYRSPRAKASALASKARAKEPARKKATKTAKKTSARRKSAKSTKTAKKSTKAPKKKTKAAKKSTTSLKSPKKKATAKTKATAAKKKPSGTKTLSRRGSGSRSAATRKK